MTNDYSALATPEATSYDSSDTEVRSPPSMDANGPTSILEPEAVAAARPSLLDRADGVAAAESLPAADGRPDAPVQRTPQVRRTGIVLRPNNSRVVIRPFELQSE